MKDKESPNEPTSPDAAASAAANDSRDLSISTTLTRGLEILACFKFSGVTAAQADIALSNAEIARRLGINKATVSRLCKTLIKERYLRRDSSGRFLLAPRILSLTYPLFASMKWRLGALGAMKEIAGIAKGSVSLSLFSGPDTVFVQTTGDPGNYPHVPEVGMTMPVPASSAGRALLSMLTTREYEDKCAEVSAAYPLAYEQLKPKIAQALDSCHERGFCVAFGDWRPDIYGVSAPVVRTSDGLVVALSCGVPAYRTDRDAFEQNIGPRIAAVAKNLRFIDSFCS